MFLHSFPELPLELIEQVVDCLQDDIRSLKHCSLISFSWLHASHYHLLSSVSVVSRKEEDRNFSKFYDSLQTSPHRFGRHVRTLKLSSALSSEPQDDYTTPYLSISPDTLSHVMAYLPNLRNLSCKWITLHSSERTMSGQVPQRLNFVSLTGICTDTLSSLVYLLNMFTHINILVIGGLSTGDDYPATPGPLRPSLLNAPLSKKVQIGAVDIPHLPSLSLQSSLTRKRVWGPSDTLRLRGIVGLLCNTLQTVADTASLQSLSIAYRSMTDGPFIETLLGAVGEQLRSLSFHIHPYSTPLGGSTCTYSRIHITT